MLNRQQRERWQEQRKRDLKLAHDLTRNFRELIADARYGRAQADLVKLRNKYLTQILGQQVNERTETLRAYVEMLDYLLDLPKQQLEEEEEQRPAPE